MRIGRADGDGWLRLSEAAHVLGVSLNTLRRWSDSGKLTCYRSPGGHRRYRHPDVEALMRSQAGDRAPTELAQQGRRDGGETRPTSGSQLCTMARVAAEGVSVASCRFLVGSGDAVFSIAGSYTSDGADLTGHADDRTDDWIAAEVLRTGRRMLITDLRMTALIPPTVTEAYRRRDEQALLALPMPSGDRLVGVMVLADPKGGRSFPGPVVALAELLARQAGALVADDETTQRADRVPTLDFELASQTAPVAAPSAAPHTRGDPGQPHLRVLCERLRGELGAVACDISGYDSATGIVSLLATTATGRTPPIECIQYRAADVDGLADVLSAAATVTTSPLDAGHLGDVRRRRQQDHAGHVTRAPLRLGPDVVGLLEVYTAKAPSLDRKEMALIEASAALATLALTGEADGAAQSRRIADLDDIIARLAEHSPLAQADALAQTALDAFTGHHGVCSCTLYRLRDDDLVPVAWSPSAPRTAPGSRALAGLPPAAEAVATRATVVVPAKGNAQPLARLFLESAGVAGALFRPLMFSEQVVALLEVDTAQPSALDSWTPAIDVLADELAVVLGSGDAIDRLQRRNRDLALVVETGLEDTARLSGDEVLHTVVERLSELTHTPVADIYTVEGDTLRALVSYGGGRFDDEWEGVVIPLLRYPCSRRAVETGEITTVTRLDDPLLGTDGRYSLEKWGYQSQLSLPLISAGRVLGLLELSDYVPRDFVADLELIRGLGHVAAHELEKAALFEQVERRSRILNELVDLGALANHSRDLEALLRRMAERLLLAVDAADCDIFQVSDEGLRCVASYDRSGFDEQPVGRLMDPDSYPTLAAAVAAHEVLVINGSDDPQLTESERAIYREYGFASEVCIPLVVNERLYGLIDLYDTRERDYTEYLSFLRSVGQTLAGALESSILLGQLEQRTSVLREIVELGAATSQTRDQQELLRTIAARLRDTIQAADCDVFTLQEGRLRCLVSADLRGFDEEVVGDVLDVERFPATAMAVHSGEPMIIASLDDPKLTDYERESYARYGFQSELCIPLVVGERVIGLIDVFDTRPRDYAAFIDYLRSVGRMTAGAIENAMLLQQLEQTNATLNLLVESGLEFGATLELAPVLHSVAQRLCAVTDAPGCYIYTIQADELRCVARLEKGVAVGSSVDTAYPLAELPLTRAAVQARQPLLVTDIAADPRLSTHERDEDMRCGHGAKIELPLVSRGQVVGIAALYDDHPRQFEDLDLLQSLAQVAANALANATLFERLDRTADRMALVTDVSYELSSSLDLGEVLRSTALRLCSVADMPMCDIYTLRGDTLVNVVSLEDGEIDNDWQGRTLRLADWAALQRAVDTRLPVSIETLDDPLLLPDERSLMEAHGETSELAVPLISKQRVIGVLELLDRRGARTFSPEEIDTVSAVCRVAALAIDNADLVENLQLRNHENEMLNEIAGATSVSLNLPDIAAAAIDKLRQFMPFDYGIVALRRDEQTFDVAYSTQPGASPALELLAAAPADGLLRRIRDEKVIALDLPADLPEGVELPIGEELGSAVLIALPKGSELVGVLGLGAVTAHAFGAMDRHLLERTGTHLALAVDNSRMYGDIKHMHLSNLKALSSALNAKDYYTLGHAARVAAYMMLLGEELGWPVDLLRQVEEAAYLHDIGKIGVSDRVLLKPSGLNLREWELMRQHPIFSADIIRSLFPEELVLGVRHHHERFEGGGYPDGLSGDAIPLIARAMCVVDSYDAMSFRRPYRHGLIYPECIAELQHCRGTQFDPLMVDAFVRVLGRLADGREQARRVAQEAASRVDPDEHALLRSPEDERRPEYLHILETFRDVCAANPPTRFITSHVRLGKKTAVVVDSGDAGPAKPHIGDEMMTDDELVEVFAGRDLDANVLFVDQWGVWISGTAPVLDGDGQVVAAVTADIPATEGISEFEGLRSNVAQTFASMLHTAAVQAGRSEIEAITDGLTGLYNHRYFHERLSEEVERCLDQAGHVSLLFCDLDNFRAFNELHGHSAGDQALRAVARVIERSIRHVDIAARFGGEEFAAILMDTDEQGALDVAERIRAGVLQAKVAAADSLSISIGVASCPSDAVFKEELIDKADWAMYLAKRRGRDLVMSFSAQHGTDTPEQAAAVTSSYVTAMSELVAARDAYERRRRYAIAHLAQAVGTELGLDARDLRAMAAASETDAPQGVTGTARDVVELAAAYQALVAERPYREQLSEAEALDELLNCPAMRDDRELADAFERVLSGEVRRR